MPKFPSVTSSSSDLKATNVPKPFPKEAGCLSLCRLTTITCKATPSKGNYVIRQYDESRPAGTMTLDKYGMRHATPEETAYFFSEIPNTNVSLSEVSDECLICSIQPTINNNSTVGSILVLSLLLV